MDLADKVLSLAKRRGFAFASSEIYGGAGSTWDFGPLGVELKNNVKRAWWRAMVQLRDDIVGLDAAILMHPRVWEASGHVENFTDPLVDCKNCKHRFRIDDLPDGERLIDAWRAGSVDVSSIECPSCGLKQLTVPRNFNLMFKTHVGPVEESASVAWLRPETAQGIYVDFENVQQSARRRIPFGIAQIGKAFRNEITPGNFIFRTREFEQMEMQYFVRPDDAAAKFEEWKAERMRWYVSLGIAESKLRHRVRLPVRVEGARGCPQQGGLGPAAPHRVQRKGSLVLRRPDEREVHPERRRDLGWGRPSDVRVPSRGIR